jgi:predicted metal-dependent phosphoesterase TrpH
MHTTASDGRLSPDALVGEAVAAGLTTIAVTDHDTSAATRRVAEVCAAQGVQAVSGIEITAVEREHDVHILGYFIDPGHDGLAKFLHAQQRQRIDRVVAIAARLGALDMPIDVAELLAAAGTRQQQSIGRPQIARLMIEAGYVSTMREAFDRWLARARPAYIPRVAASAAAVIEVIHSAGGVASLAHPGETRIDDSISRLQAYGLDAIEVYHSGHGGEERDRYLRLAGQLDLLVTGGSDFHGDPEQGIALGSVSLPARQWERLLAKVAWTAKVG